MRKQSILFFVSFFSILTSCSNPTSSTPITSEKATTGTIPTSKVTTSEEKTSVLEEALKKVQTSDLTLEAEATHNYHYPSPMAETKDATRDSTMTASYTSSAYSLSELSGDSKNPVTLSYFKDENGYLNTEYLKFDNTIGLQPVYVNGVKQLYDSVVSNPFAILQVSDFTKVDDVTYTITSEKANLFVDHFIDEAYEGGKLTFTVDKSGFREIVGEGFKTTNNLITQNDTLERNITFSFDVTSIEYKENIIHLQKEAAKQENAPLKTLFTKTSNKKMRVLNGSEKGSYTAAIYFLGDRIFFSFNPSATSIEETGLAFYLYPGEDGKLDFKYYDTEWHNDSENESDKFFPVRASYEELFPKVYEVSADIFTKNNNTYNPVDAAIQRIGSNFVSWFYDYTQLSSMNDFRINLNGFQIDVSEDQSSFELSLNSLVNGNGFQVKSSNFMKFDELGTCEVPFDLKLPK